ARDVRRLSRPRPAGRAYPGRHKRGSGAPAGPERARDRPSRHHPRARDGRGRQVRGVVRLAARGHRGQGRRAGRPVMLGTLRRLSSPWGAFRGMTRGTLLGWLAPEAGAALKPLSTTFLRMIKSVVVPIIFGTLVVGIAGHGDDLRRIGRLALKSIGYFWL